MENQITRILNDNLSNTCFSEVTDTLITELALSNGENVWSILNDNLSNSALDELENQSDGLTELKTFLTKK